VALLWRRGREPLPSRENERELPFSLKRGRTPTESSKIQQRFASALCVLPNKRASKRTSIRGGRRGVDRSGPSLPGEPTGLKHRKGHDPVESRKRVNTRKGQKRLCLRRPKRKVVSETFPPMRSSCPAEHNSQLQLGPAAFRSR